MPSKEDAMSVSPPGRIQAPPRPRQQAAPKTRKLVAPPPPVSLDPEVVGEARDLLRELERATTRLTDALDVTGFPAEERQSTRALLSRLASGLPSVTVGEVLEALRHLAADSGPAALFPDAEVMLSIPDEARELLYLVDPLLTLARVGARLPRHAGVRLRAAPLTFTLTRVQTKAALADVAWALRELMAVPLRQPALSTIRSRHVARRESTTAAVTILASTLGLAIIVGLAVAFVVMHGTLPFNLSRFLP
jgi:hypothetical protein